MGDFIAEVMRLTNLAAWKVTPEWLWTCCTALSSQVRGATGLWFMPCTWVYGAVVVTALVWLRKYRTHQG